MNKKKKMTILICVLLVLIVAVGLLIGLKHNKSDSNSANTNSSEAVSDSDSVSGDEEYDPVDDTSIQAGDIVVQDDPTAKDYENGIKFEEEEEEATLKFKKTDATKFLGTWKSTSGHANYYYGGIKITINSDNTWKGTVTGDSYSGNWVAKDGGLYLTGDVFNFTLNFTDTGRMVFQQDYDDNSTDPVAVVLSK